MGMHKEQLPQRTRVVIIESESGWGQKIDEVLYFDTKEEAKTFVADYNSKNTEDHTPSWYMYAEIS